MKITRKKPKMITDIVVFLFNVGFKRGVIQVCNRYARENDLYMQDFNSKKSIKYFSYYDANNLYGWAMSKYVPYEKF